MIEHYLSRHLDYDLTPRQGHPLTGSRSPRYRETAPFGPGSGGRAATGTAALGISSAAARGAVFGGARARRPAACREDTGGRSRLIRAAAPVWVPIHLRGSARQTAAAVRGDRQTAATGSSSRTDQHQVSSTACRAQAASLVPHLCSRPAAMPARSARVQTAAQLVRRSCGMRPSTCEYSSA